MNKQTTAGGPEPPYRTSAVRKRIVRYVMGDAYETLRARLQAAEELLLSLTPGGSEFHGSPERCAEWVRDSLASVVEQAQKRKAAEAERDEMRAALEAVCAYADNPSLVNAAGMSPAEKMSGMWAQATAALRGNQTASEKEKDFDAALGLLKNALTDKDKTLDDFANELAALRGGGGDSGGSGEEE